MLTIIVAALCGFGGRAVWSEGLSVWGLRIVGLLSAGLAAGTLVLSSYRKQSLDEMAHRMRRGQHADFGKLLRMANAQDKKIKLPLVGETSPRTLAGVGAFVLVAGWWWSPLAPVGIRQIEVQDLGIPLREEIAAVVLVMPNAQTAVLQPPLVSPLAAKLAEEVDEGNAFELGRKAVGQSRFDDARDLLQTAEQDGDAPLHEIYAMRAQNEMYAGRFADGVAWYEKALLEKSDDPLLLAQAAAARMHVGGIVQLRKAEVHVTDALALFEGKSAEERERDTDLAVCLHVQTVLLVCQGKQFDDALQLCFDAGEIFHESTRKGHPCQAAALNNYGVVYLLQARYASAGGMYRQARTAWAQSVGEKHPHVAAGLGNLAMVDCLQAHYATARESLEQAAEIRASLAETHPARAPLLAIDRSAAVVPYLVLSRAVPESAEGLQLAEEALATAEETFGAENPVQAAVFDSLGTLYAGQARFVKAEICYDRARGITERYWGKTHPYLAGIHNHRARLRLDRGRLGPADSVQEQFDRAETDAQKAQELLTTGVDKEHAGVAAALTVLGRLRLEQMDLALAEPYLAQALKIQEKVFAEELPDGGSRLEHPAVARTMGSLAALKNSARVYLDGAKGYAKATKMAEAVLGAEHPEVAELWYGLAKLYKGVGETDDARVCLDKARAIQEQPLATGDERFHPDLAVTLETYAELLRQSAPAEAAAMEAQAAQIRSRQDEIDKQDLQPQ